MIQSLFDFSGLSLIEFSFRGATLVIIITSFMALYRILIGPKRSDRILGVNVLTNNVIVILVILAFLTQNYTFIDAATVYVLCAFIGTLSVLKFLVYDRGS
ncbi:monovalent cation/H+ antiporter complex subunit F [Natranaerofaba carboxydovora]|uniref:monovalent cation/H+ antiporter complex subunit F n=1 Tax=Natranaerofaba carboxydovora TaxID=2742683 RepID=UPI001F13C0E2|nr:monovalent cation/H+ antiporter complex subunit F [Natranaerofaba carboxydovora]UMZ74586.1 Na(+)/H(+) antiporter subunit F [Natranaerofaba carboxydovora]